MFLGEEKGTRVSRERAVELAATEAGTVAAACPFCHTMFRDALGSITQAPPKLLDIAQLAAAAISKRAAVSRQYRVSPNLARLPDVILKSDGRCFHVPKGR